MRESVEPGDKKRSAMVTHRIERASGDHAHVLAGMVAALLLELSAGNWRGGVPDLLPTVRERLDDRSGFFAYVAFDQDDDPVGVITVSTVSAIYAAGVVGTIQELYVAPTSRSTGVGRELLARIVEVGRRSGWNRIEVGAPGQEQWSRTINFYKANGFTEIGPRLQHRLTIAPGTAGRRGEQNAL